MKNILTAQKYKWIKKVTLLSILIISVAWYSQEFRINNNPIDARKALELHKQIKLQGFYTYTVENEFLPKTASFQNIKPKGNAPLLLLNPPGKLKELNGNNRYRMRYQIINKVPTAVIINQFYMPGWRVIVDGMNVSPEDLENCLAKDGRIQFYLSAEKHHYIEAFYGGPPGWFMRNIVILITLLAFIAFCFYNDFNRIKEF